MNYKNKYIKYKTKYLELKKMKVSNQNGGQCIKKILYENGNFFVENNIDNDKLDMNSTFLIGSITKIFTIYTILILHQNNLLNINDNIIKYVKTKNKDNNDAFEKITILDIINHTSGLKGMPDNKKSIYVYHKNASSCMKTFIDENLFTKEFGTDNYSNIGYIILGYIIEKITNLTYVKAYYKYIFNIIGMTNTNVGNTNIKLFSEYCKKIKKYENNFKYWGSSAGGLYSCVNDLLLFAKNSFQLLNNETIDLLINKIYIGKMKNPRGNIGHSGKIYGSHTRFYFTNDDNTLKKIYIEFNTCISIKKEIDEYYKLI
jgi:CubicO group peptidase (beta-lactamase class C family)